MVRFICLLWIFLFRVAGFDFFSGRYRVLYPIRKMIQFTEDNNEIIERSIVRLTFHPEHRMFFHLRHINNTTMTLENIRNSSDLIILQQR